MRSMGPTCALLSVAMIWLGGGVARADMRGPWVSPVSAPRPVVHTRTGPVVALVSFYRQVISPADGPRCRMYPTCAAYGEEALRRHGFWLGLFLTTDRLMHEATAAPPYFELINIDGRDRVHDPVP